MALCHCSLKLFDQFFSSDITNFLIELRQKIPYEHGIKIISPRQASPPNQASSPPYEWHLNLIIDFLSNRKQRVVLSAKYSLWSNIEAEVPHASVLRPLFFLIYINDLSDNLITNPKLFPDDTSLFPIVHDPNATANDLHNDWAKNKWLGLPMEINFNPDPFKQIQDVLIPEKLRAKIIPAYISIIIL